MPSRWQACRNGPCGVLAALAGVQDDARHLVPPRTATAIASALQAGRAS